MAFTSSEWTINYTTKTVTNNDSGTGTNLPSATGDYSHVGEVLEFFQWLADEFANSSQMDDDYAFVSDTPTVYRWVNDWAFGNLTHDYKYLQGGSIESSDADELWSNLYSIGSTETGTQLYMIQNDDEVAPWWITGAIDILVNVKTGGVWIQSPNTAGTATDGGVWIYAREFGDTFDHNFSNLSGGGRNPIGINTAPDSGNKSGEIYITVASATGFDVGNFIQDDVTLAIGKIAKIDGNNIYLNAVRGGTNVFGTNACTEYTEREAITSDATSTTSAVVDVVKGYSDITDTFGTISRDLNNGNGSVSYDVEIDCAARPMTEVYEWLKFLVRYGSAGATYTVDGDDGQEYRSANEGVYTDVKVAPFGTLAGATFYGARGVWVTNYSAADFVLIDATGTEQSPPNYQKVTVNHVDLSGAVSGFGSVTVFVAEISDGSIWKDQYTIDAAGADYVNTTTVLDINKTPQSGVFRVDDTKYAYTSYDSSSLLGVTPNPSAETGGMYVPLLDLSSGDISGVTTKQSDNIIYASNISVRTVVRRYGTKPYTADTTFGNTGLTFSPILTDDPQAT